MIDTCIGIMVIFYGVLGEFVDHSKARGAQVCYLNAKLWLLSNENRFDFDHGHACGSPGVLAGKAQNLT